MRACQVLVTLHHLAFSDGCDLLANQAVQPKHALADRIAAAHEYVVFSVPRLPVFSVVVYNHTIPRQSPDWSLERVARNNRITEVAESNQVLNGALNFELGLLDGYRFHHRHQGATDGHPAEFSLWRGRGLEIPPGPSLTQPHKVMVLWCDRGSVRDRVRPQTHDKRSANAFGHFLTAFAHTFGFTWLTE